MPQTAREVAPWVEKAARIGYVAKALLYATVGILAAQAALGRGGRTTDLGGALREVVRAPMGEALLLVIGVGLAGYAIWRILDAITDAEGKGGDAKGLARRIGSAARGLGHGALAVAAFGLATGSNDGGGGDKRELASKAVDVAGGSWLLWLAAAAVLGYACYQLYRAYAAKLGRQLDLGAVSAGVGWSACCWCVRRGTRIRERPVASATRSRCWAGWGAGLSRSSRSAWWRTPSTSC